MSRFSNYIIIYLFIGVIMFGGGAVPYEEAGLVSAFTEQEADGSITVNPAAGPSANASGSGGMLNNLIGPVRNTLGSIAGGQLLAVYGAIDRFFGYYAWPITVMQYNNAPPEVVALSSVLVAGFTMSVLRVFKGSV